MNRNSSNNNGMNKKSSNNNMHILYSETAEKEIEMKQTEIYGINTRSLWETYIAIIKYGRESNNIFVSYIASYNLDCAHCNVICHILWYWHVDQLCIAQN